VSACTLGAAPKKEDGLCRGLCEPVGGAAQPTFRVHSVCGPNTNNIDVMFFFEQSQLTLRRYSEATLACPTDSRLARLLFSATSVLN
jgi:hypothetical protein